MAETMVRMGEFAFSGSAGDVLVSLGLGSCVGVALLDRRAAVAGLAHVVLPAAEGRGEPPGKFADTAVPALLAAVVALGAPHPPGGGAGRRRQHVLVRRRGLDNGQRNDDAVRAELEVA